MSSSTALTLQRTLLAKGGDYIGWSETVINDNDRILSSRLPAEADRSTVKVSAGLDDGRSDPEAQDWSFTVAPGGKAELELSADLLPEHAD